MNYEQNVVEIDRENITWKQDHPCLELLDSARGFGSTVA